MRKLTWISTSVFVGLTMMGVGAGCDGSPPPANTGGGGAGGTTAQVGGGGAGGGTGGATTTAPDGGGGAGGEKPTVDCDTPAPRETRGSAIAISADDSTIVSVNRDVGTVTVMSVDYTDGDPKMTKVKEVDVGAGSEPWQVVMDSCGLRAYVVLRNSQKVVALRDLKTDPKIEDQINVGSEPTGIAITPFNSQLYVSNWVDGTVSVINTGYDKGAKKTTMSAASTVDLNKALVDTGLLGAGLAARPAMAHPRAIAITNDGDGDDTDETVLVTEWFMQRTEAEAANGSNADVSKKGLVYQFTTQDLAPTTLSLPPVQDTGFNDSKNQVTGCFPNQVSSVTIKNGFAYVTSTCASPEGPLGVVQKNACTGNAQCTAAPNLCDTAVGSCQASCTVDADCGFGSPAGTCVTATGACKPIATNVKTTTHPALSIIELASGNATTTNLDKLFNAQAGKKRMPHLPTDLDFVANFAYVSGMGADAVFRLEISPDDVVKSVGGSKNFIDMRTGDADKLIRNPIGLAIAHDPNHLFGFVNNDGSRDVTAIEFNAQQIAGNQVDDFRITQASDLPASGSPAEEVLKGKRFFNTGLGRWSLAGEAWGSCAACHIDGLTDNVTWYFARGPRQSTSLDGSYSPDGLEQRIFNWTAIFDETADFELNTRGVSGGVGAIVKALSDPPVNADRIDLVKDFPGSPQQGLQGAAKSVGDPNGTANPKSLIGDQLELTAYVRSVRAPKKPSNLNAADAAAGKALFSGGGNCVGCHSGKNWTISKVFYTPGAPATDPATSLDPLTLSNLNWNVSLNGFPTQLLPVNTAAMPALPTTMRTGTGSGNESINCALRPVGTFGVAPAEVGVAELRADMVTPAQGAADAVRGYNVPSLFGVQVGAPYFHAGQARTLEELFDKTLFAGHHQSAIAQVFVPDATQVKQLVAYLLSIDEAEPTFATPAKGASGGDLCFAAP